MDKGYGANHEEEIMEQHGMIHAEPETTGYRSAFWIVLSALILICYHLFQTGGAVFPKLQKLNQDIKNSQIKVEHLQTHKHRMFTQEVVSE